MRASASAAAACAAAMGTGIVSLDLHLAGLPAPSTVLLALAVAIDVALLVTGGLFREMAGVPAVAVVGSGLAARGDRVWPFLVAAALLLAWQLPRLRLPERTRGADLLPVVAAQSVVVLAGDVQRHADAPGLTVPAIVLLCAGALGYAAIAARLHRGHVTGGEGDHWIAGGAAAITVLACATLAGADGGEALRVAAVAGWIVALAWLPVLVAGELRRPRRGTLGRRWATVFPVGMYAAMSFAVAAAAGLSAAHAFALGWTPVAVLVWALVAAAAVARLTGAGRQRERPG